MSREFDGNINKITHADCMDVMVDIPDKVDVSGSGDITNLAHNSQFYAQFFAEKLNAVAHKMC